MFTSFEPPPCPKCAKKLTWAYVDSRFICPHCHAQLRSNQLGLGLVLLILGPLPFLPMLAVDTVWVNAAGAILMCVVPLWIFFLAVRVVEADAT